MSFDPRPPKRRVVGTSVSRAGTSSQIVRRHGSNRAGRTRRAVPWPWSSRQWTGDRRLARGRRLRVGRWDTDRQQQHCQFHRVRTPRPASWRERTPGHPVRMRVASPSRARVAIGALFFLNGFGFATWVCGSRGAAGARTDAGDLGAALMGLGAGSFVAMRSPAGHRPHRQPPGRRGHGADRRGAAGAAGVRSNAVLLGAALALFGAAMARWTSR